MGCGFSVLRLFNAWGVADGGEGSGCEASDGYALGEEGECNQADDEERGADSPAGIDV